LGGGWFGNYYYPGHGMFLFYNAGRRFPMREQHRRDWGGRGYEGRQRGDTTAGAHGWREDRRCDRRKGKKGADGQWRGGGGRGTVVAPKPNIVASQDAGRGRGDSNVDTVPLPQRQGSPIQENVASFEQLPEPSPEPQDTRALRQREPEGGLERAD